MMMGFGLIWLILIIAVFAYLMGWRPENLNLGQPQDRSEQRTPEEILKERYARGELNKEEYHQMRSDLK